MAPTGRLELAFASRSAGDLPGVMPYFTAGFPRLHDTAKLLLSAQQAGCLAAEIGIPFSDPIADGPTVQATGTQALANGMTPGLALDQIAQARSGGVTIPLAVMVYSNLVMAHGIEDFTARVAGCGADALIVPDLPSGEAEPTRLLAGRHGIALIPMVAPTTPTARIAAACRGAAGFVYCVSLAGTTGARSSLSEAAIPLLARVAEATSLPRALGFGISRHEHVVELAGRAEAVIVGSALLDAVAAGSADPAGAAGRFLEGLGSGGQAG